MEKKNIFITVIVWVVAFMLVAIAVLLLELHERAKKEIEIKRAAEISLYWEQVEAKKKTEMKNAVESEDATLGVQKKTDVKSKLEITPDEENIELIKKYYENFWVNDIAEAYAMKYEPKESFKTFESWYKNTLYATPYDFKSLGKNKYGFIVNLIEDDGTNRRYDVTMEVIDGKLKTISSKEINFLMVDAEKIFDDSLKAYAKWENGNDKLYIVRNGIEILADNIVRKGDDLSSKFAAFKDLEFSKSGRYLMYKIQGWEGEWLKVYDTVGLKLVHEVGAAGGLMGFTDDEKHFYQCEGTGMSSGYAEVLSVPEFEREKNLLKVYDGEDVGAGGQCVYDSATNTLKYNLWLIKENETPEYIYYF